MSEIGQEQEAERRRQLTAAREAIAIDSDAYYWNLYVRLSFNWDVDEITASKHVSDLARSVRARIPGTAFKTGLHKDRSQIHAHLRVYLPKRLFSDPTLPAPAKDSDWSPWVQAILQWRHGDLWAEPFSRHKARPHTHDGAKYDAKSPETVMAFGTAPLYHPKRH